MSSAETTPECRTDGSTINQGVPVVPKGSSSDLSPNSQSSPGSPDVTPVYIGIGRPISSDLLDVPILQVKDSTVFVLITFPTVSLVTAIIGITTSRQNLSPQYKVVSPYGDTSGFNFDETTRFVPGDYCFGLVFKTSEEAQSVSFVRILLQAEPVSNLMVAQMIFGLCRSLGFEPSHVMKYPTRSVSTGNPFYRKIRSETSKLTERIAALETAIRTRPVPEALPSSEVLKLTERVVALEKPIEVPGLAAIGSQLGELLGRLGRLESLVGEIRGQPVVTVEQIERKLNDLRQAVDSRQEKGPVETIPMEMIENLILEKETYLNKLQEAEDFIDQLIAEDEKKSSRQGQWFQPTWDNKKAVRR